jgi:uncharacterized membrane protein YfcA
MTATDILGSLALLTSSFFSASAGIGGGTLNVALLMSIMGFSFTEAARLSTCIIFGNVSSQILVNWSTHHPRQESRQIIYWDAVLLLAPCQLVGANIGVILGDAISSSLEYVIAISVLLLANYFNTIKAITFWDKESERLLWGDAVTVPIFSNRDNKGVDAIDEINIKTSDEPTSSGSQKLIVPYNILQILGVVWVAYALYYVGLSRLSECSTYYYVLLACAFPVLIAEIMWAKSTSQSEQSRNPWLILEGDLDWEQVGYMPSVGAFFVGVIASVIGIGGGEILIPFFLSLKLLPQVAAATSAVNAFLSTSSSLIHLMVLGYLDWEYVPWMAAIGLVGGFCGRKFGVWTTLNFGRPSMLVILLICLTSASVILFTYYLFSEDIDFSFNSIC